MLLIIQVIFVCIVSAILVAYLAAIISSMIDFLKKKKSKDTKLKFRIVLDVLVSISLVSLGILCFSKIENPDLRYLGCGTTIMGLWLKTTLQSFLKHYKESKENDLI